MELRYWLNRRAQPVSVLNSLESPTIANKSLRAFSLEPENISILLVVGDDETARPGIASPWLEIRMGRSPDWRSTRFFGCFSLRRPSTTFRLSARYEGLLSSCRRSSPVLIESLILYLRRLRT